MVRPLGQLERLERGGVFALPFEPARQAIDRVLPRRPGAFDAEPIAVVLALRVRDPIALALDAHDAERRVVCHYKSPKRDGFTRSSSGSILPSSIASATS